MTVDTTLRYAEAGQLHLDAKNPRLGRLFKDRPYKEEDVLDAMKDWSLEELAVSFLGSGFFPQEPLIAVNEHVDGTQQLVVVEGNRRLAALRLLNRYSSNPPAKGPWREIVASATPEQLGRLARVPYLIADSRADVIPYLGFRHVTGIKQWDPPEKAAFIANMIDSLGMSYDEVRRAIGSKTPTVRQHYIAYRLMLEMEDLSEEIDIERVRQRFSVLYLSLRAPGVQSFLSIDVSAAPGDAQNPVPPSKKPSLVLYARWMFGDKDHDPVLPESRDVDRFGEILAEEQALEYLIRAPDPSFTTAYRYVRGNPAGVARLLDVSSDFMEEALSFVHHVKDSPVVQKSAKRAGRDAQQLLSHFPEIEAELRQE